MDPVDSTGPFRSCVVQRIVILTRHIGRTGGIERVVQTMEEHLKHLCAQLEVRSVYGSEEVPGQSDPTNGHGSLAWLVARFRVHSSRSRARRRARRQLRELLTDGVPTIAIADNYTLEAMPRRPGLPLIAHVHASADVVAAPWRYEALGSIPRAMRIVWIGWMWLQSRRMIAALRRANVVVSVSSQESERLSRLLRVPVLHIPNPLPTHVGVEEDSRTVDRVKFCYVGRLSHEKGVDLLIRAFSALVKRHSDWRLRIIGDGIMGEELARLAELLDCADRVEFCGRQDQPGPYYQSADILVLPSRTESFGLVALEAMSLGRPVIATDSGPGIAEVVVDGVTGIITDNENVESLAVAMENLALNDAAMHEMGKAAQVAAQRYVWANVEPQWVHALECAADVFRPGGRDEGKK